MQQSVAQAEGTFSEAAASRGPWHSGTDRHSVARPSALACALHRSGAAPHDAPPRTCEHAELQLEGCNTQVRGKATARVSV